MCSLFLLKLKKNQKTSWQTSLTYYWYCSVVSIATRIAERKKLFNFGQSSGHRLVYRVRSHRFSQVVRHKYLNNRIRI